MINNYPKTFPKRNSECAEPGVGDINVMVKPSSLKNKTPMCLVNELARFNRIQHQYKLTKEEGPPHRKRFTVTLKLGDTEFEAQGTSIKKAQHEAAAIALRNTKYRHPPPKLLPNTRVNTTPTVELNALAMKRGEPTIYTMLSQPLTTYFQPSFPLNYYGRNIYQSRTVYDEYSHNEYIPMNGYSFSGSQLNRYKCPQPYKILLKIGDREYIAEGSSAQLARHRAAKKALEDLRNLPEENKTASAESAETTERVSDDVKSPISAVHEKAFRYDMEATFQVIDEQGPPHMRTFITECRVGEQFKTIGEGNGKKLSKRRAAEKMLVLLQSLPSLTKLHVTSIEKRRIRKRILSMKKKKRIEPNQENKPVEVNPITRLMEYQKKKHGKEPVYVLVEEKGIGRKKQFSIEVKIDNVSCVGMGTSKKDAKRKASEDMLKLLGLDTKNNDTPKILEPTVKEEKIEQNNSSPGPIVNGKQLAPGLLLVPNVNLNSKPNIRKQNPPQKDYTKMTNGTSHYAEPPSTTTTTRSTPSPPTPSPPQQYISAKQKLFANMNIQKNIAKEQLIRLADMFGYEVQFSDFPKGHHHQEFLSLVTLNTSPPQTCYGSGDSTETAQNEAAYNALSMISEMGIENLFSKKNPAQYIPEKEIVS